MKNNNVMNLKKTTKTTINIGGADKQIEAKKAEEAALSAPNLKVS